MRIHTTHTRDAALRQLNRMNRWLVAGSVVLTGVFAEAAAHAFPGRTTNGVATDRGKRSGADPSSSSKTTPQALQPPAHAPQAATESSPSSQTPAPTEETSTPSQESPPASEPDQAQESATTRETAPTQASASAEESGAVVSGGS